MPAPVLRRGGLLRVLGGFVSCLSFLLVGCSQPQDTFHRESIPDVPVVRPCSPVENRETGHQGHCHLHGPILLYRKSARHLLSAPYLYFGSNPGNSTDCQHILRGWLPLFCIISILFNYTKIICSTVRELCVFRAQLFLICGNLEHFTIFSSVNL